MIKMIVGGKRKPGMSREDFAKYWTTTHAEFGRALPGIKRYVINIVPDRSGSGREMAYDGFAEAWFESEEDMQMANHSPLVKVGLEDEKNLFDLSTMFRVIVQENVMIGDA